jgi:hypothetical protein
LIVSNDRSVHFFSRQLVPFHVDIRARGWDKPLFSPACTGSADGEVIAWPVVRRCRSGENAPRETIASRGHCAGHGLQYHNAPRTIVFVPYNTVTCARQQTTPAQTRHREIIPPPHGGGLGSAESRWSDWLISSLIFVVRACPPSGVQLRLTGLPLIRVHTHTQTETTTAGIWNESHFSQLNRTLILYMYSVLDVAERAISHNTRREVGLVRVNGLIKSSQRHLLFINNIRIYIYVYIYMCACIVHNVHPGR